MSSFFPVPKTEGRKIEGVANTCYHNKVLIRFPIAVKSWMVSFNDVLKNIFLQKVLDLSAAEGILIFVQFSPRFYKLKMSNADAVSISSSCEAEVEGMICVHIWGGRQNHLSYSKTLHWQMLT